MSGERGRIRAVCISPAKGTEKRPVEKAVLIRDHGIENDAHAGKWHRQVSLLSWESVEEFNRKGAGVTDGAFGEILLVEGIRLKDLAGLHPDWAEVSAQAAEQAEIRVKYAGYLEKQENLIRRAREMEETKLSPEICYAEIEHLRLEARQKLDRQKPVSLGAASRIPGVNPADVAVLSVWLEKQKRK